jgi:hypothetical protein
MEQRNLYLYNNIKFRAEDGCEEYVKIFEKGSFDEE